MSGLTLTAQQATGIPDFHAGTPVHQGLSDSLFGDEVWFFDPTVQKSTARRFQINFGRVPAKSRDFSKHFVWLLLNSDTPVDQLRRKSSVRSRLTVQSVVTTFADLAAFFRWFDFRSELILAELTDDALEAYSAHIAEGTAGYNVKSRRLFAISRIWLLSPYLPPHYRVVIPPWEKADSLEEALGPSDWSAENKTEPIHPQTMSPLLIWSLRLVNELSDDILNAARIQKEMESRIPDKWPSNTKSVLSTYWDDLRRAGHPLPSTVKRGSGNGGVERVAVQYIAAKLGLSTNGLSTLLAGTERTVGGGAPLEFTPAGTIDGTPWITAIDYYDAQDWKRVLLTACMVVVCYLSGMRGEEVRAMRRGCCARLEGHEGAIGFVVEGKTFKSATDSSGNLIPEGKTREIPWHVIAPVADAIRIAELIHNDDLLFPHRIFISDGASARAKDMSVTNARAKAAFGELINWCNSQAVRLGRTHEIIPNDPAGNITVRRFRRTLAWFIYRLPGGRVALGIQYGHLHSYTTDGYGSRVSAGLRHLFPMEEAFSVSDSLQRAVADADRGTLVSGPAATRYANAVAEYRNIYAGKMFGVKQAAALMRNPALRIYDNGAQPLACCYDASKALCHPDRTPSRSVEQSPDPTACDSRCGNIARTDGHMIRLQGNMDDMTEAIESEFTPIPIRERLKQRVSALEKMIQEHRDRGVDL